ncbi:MAG: DUF1127 domain-containing protein [Pseudomonadota bacterium]
MVAARRRPIAAFLTELGRYLQGSPQSRWRQREALLALDDRLLRDVGLTRREVLAGRRWTSGGRPVPPHGLPGIRGLAPSERYW